MALVAFWIALAAVLIAGSWRRKHLEAMRHETIRMLIQKEGPVNIEQVKELLYPRPAPLPAGHPWARVRTPTDTYRNFRMAGSILMISAFGVGALIAGIGLANGKDEVVIAAIGTIIFVFLIGAGFFFASRFVARRSESEPNREA
jgi:hypothetical protein